MPTIGGLSSSTVNSASSLRGYGGLASGIDRDSLIENLTYGTTSKINQQLQAQQKLEWEQEALRSITDKFYDFNQNYMSYTSSNNLLGSSLFSPSRTTVSGTNSQFVSVTGASSALESVRILGVSQLAQNAKGVTAKDASVQKLVSGNISSMSDKVTINVIGGSSLTLTYGTTNYLVSLPKEGDGYSYNGADEIAAALNKALGEVTIGTDRTLADVMEASVENGKMVLKNTDTAGNTIRIRGDSNSLMYKLGFLSSGETVAGMDDEELTITQEGLKAKNAVTYEETKTRAEWLAGQTISFTYNGTTKNITLGSQSELTTVDALVENLQKELNTAFGNERITVELSGGSISFRTTLPGTNGAEDGSSVLAINSSSGIGVLGTGAALSINAGSSNRLNLTSSLLEAGLQDQDRVLAGKTADEEFSLTINGVTIDGLKYGDSISDIMRKINENEAVGVQVSYQSDVDKFVFTATQEGASGRIEIDSGSADIFKALFGFNNDTDGAITKGQDAKVMVQYDSGERLELTRGTNTFSLNGVNLTVKGTFGYGDDGALLATAETDAVSFTAEMDTDKTVEAVRGMIDALNEIIELVNDEVSTKPNRDYAPLTSDQEEQMTESQIEKWNEKASAGMLFNDTDLRSMADALRFLASSDSGLRNIGIGVSDSYSDNGKLTFDEDTFRQALESDPDNVRQLLAGAAQTDENGRVISEGGLMVRIQEIYTKYAGMTGAVKGILVERAGSSHAPTTILNNRIQQQLDEIDDYIERLQDRLKTEQDRYISQFTALETLVSQMNSQSSWLASAFS